MTVVILFQTSGFRNFKTFYTERVLTDLRQEFPGAVGYQRFVELKASAVIPLAAFLHSRLGNCSGLSFVDATSIAICHNRRINSNKVFRGVAKRGKTSVRYHIEIHLEPAVEISKENSIARVASIAMRAGGGEGRKVMRVW